MHRLFLLEFSQPRGVGRAEVDDEKVGQRPKFFQRINKIGGGFFQRRLFGFAEVDPQGKFSIATGLCKSHGKSVSAAVVETHAIDESGGFGDSEEAGLRIAGLGMPGDAANFAESESQCLPRGNGDSILVHSGGEANGIGELDSEAGRGKVVRNKKLVEKVEHGRRTRHRRQAVQRPGMNFLRIASKQSRPNPLAIECAHDWKTRKIEGRRSWILDVRQALQP